MIVACSIISATTLFGERTLAMTPFDGDWSVLIHTDKGQCERACRYGLAIRDGGYPNLIRYPDEKTGRWSGTPIKLPGLL